MIYLDSWLEWSLLYILVYLSSREDRFVVFLLYIICMLQGGMSKVSRFFYRRNVVWWYMFVLLDDLNLFCKWLFLSWYMLFACEPCYEKVCLTRFFILGLLLSGACLISYWVSCMLYFLCTKHWGFWW